MRREREGNSLPALEHSPPSVGSVNNVKPSRESVTAFKKAYEQSASWMNTRSARLREKSTHLQRSRSDPDGRSLCR